MDVDCRYFQFFGSIIITVSAAPIVAAVRAYTAPAAGEKAEALREYAKLKEEGIISDAEFQKMKAELVSGKKEDGKELGK